MKNTIGDALYDLWIPYDDNLADAKVQMFPIERKTEKFVWVNLRRGMYAGFGTHMSRFSVEELEETGSAWNEPAQRQLYAQPQLEWPLFVISEENQRQLT